MPTDKVKGIMEGDIFMQDQDGNINKIGEIIKIIYSKDKDVIKEYFE